MFLGTKNGFQFTASADTAVDSLISRGSLFGITKSFTANGEVGIAFLPQPVNVFELPLDEAAAAAKTAGTTVYLNGDNEVVWASGSGIVEIGCVWEDIAIGATAVKVMLK